MDNEIIEVKQAEMLQAINRAEVDIQIATAKQYPRDINASLNKIATYAMMDKETAEDCFYVLRRQDANGNSSVIEAYQSHGRDYRRGLGKSPGTDPYNRQRWTNDNRTGYMP